VSLPGPARPLGHTIHALGTVDSTQIVAARLAASGATEGTVVTALHQREGRGRRGRPWLDKDGESLLMSVVLRPPVPPGQAPQLSLVAAVAIVDALRTFGELSAAIRWPNDVMVGERKICGMLPEAATSGPGAIGHLVLGIGLNVNQAAFAEPLTALATSVRMETGHVHDLARVREAVLAALDRWYARFLAMGVEGLREAWLERSQSIGRRVRAGDGRVGVAVDLADDGALVIRTEDGETVRILAGDVTMEAADAARH
jgi:BirA family transcriptional regulator, biotin operon repressor / biotin---[acetyl-CoA-carboxylase] ligase